MPDVAVVRTDQPYVADQTVEKNRARALRLIQQLLGLTGVTCQHHREQLSIALWKWTEAEGIAPYAKYNTRFISAGVKNPVGPASINHEHVWTRKDLTTQLLGKRWEPDALEALLVEQGVACIVTVEEHGQLSGRKETGWQRYAAAGIDVWDRQTGNWFDIAAVAPGPAETTAEPPAPEPLTIAELAASECRTPAMAEAVTRFAKIAGWQLAVAVPSNTAAARHKYYRVHDTLVEEPTRAAAYVHWTGKVDYALQATDLPPALLQDPLVGTLKSPYGVTTNLSTAEGFDLGCELLALALEQIRDEDA
ncbi:hypothetical protein ACQPXM_36480 [Kribbella sp. CA-253562]|uniref:hypothetical protein n=1 Tax=Kribbella sp. CA-253562 TaxID=3239942 RepID=UPI003D900E75